jgi:UDP-glucose:(heptosyl)LPS alpha-1,3-glucosyltransferase
VEQIGDDPALRAALVLGGDEVVDRHSWVEVARRYLELYSQVLVERAEKESKSSL